MMAPGPAADMAYAFGCVPTVPESLKDARFAESDYWKAVINVINKYSVPMDPIGDNYDQIVLKFADTMVRLVLDPKIDAMAELKKAQDEMNALQK